MLLLLFFAFLAGIATVLSPCILPVLPAILSASASGGKKRPLGVILGLVCSFVFFTLTLGFLVEKIGLSANVLRDSAIAIIALFGAVLLVPSLSEWFAEKTATLASFGAAFQAKEGKASSGFKGGFLVGIALGLVWTPCAGPILAAITTLVATKSLTWSAFSLTIAYSMGAALPLLGLAYGGQWALKSVPLLTRHSEGIRKLFGALMLLTALALFLNWDVAFQKKIADILPKVNFEQSDVLKKELDELRGGQVGILVGEKAPDFAGISAWINSAPLSLSDLKGKVVLVDFWTYSCINCIRTFPYLKQWYETYKDKGLVIVGVHTPEFEFEKKEENVKDAVKRFEIRYPVALDSHYKTWEAYHNFFWPAHYLIDQSGVVRQVHFGEGAYLETENAIRNLLSLEPLKEPSNKEPVAMKKTITKETYLGHLRAQSYTEQNKLKQNEVSHYDYKILQPDEIGLKGDWKLVPEFIESESDSAILGINFQASEVYLVLGGQSPLPIRVELDGKPLVEQYKTVDMNENGALVVNGERKYDVIDLKGKVERHALTLHIPKGIRVYAFTFGEGR